MRPGDEFFYKGSLYVVREVGAQGEVIAYCEEDPENVICIPEGEARRGA